MLTVSGLDMPVYCAF